MVLELDPEYAAAIAPMAEAMAAAPKFPVGDVEGRRNRTSAFMKGIPVIPGFTRKDHRVTVGGGAEIVVGEFRKEGALREVTKTIYHIHGGGMITGSLDGFANYCGALSIETGYPVFSVDYRLAPEHPHTGPVEDCWAGLQWVYANAAALSVDTSRVIVTGESSGGGLAAGLTLLARDRGLSPPLLKQVLLFPMIDDRNMTPNPALEPHLTWNYHDNATGWGALLGDEVGMNTVSEYAAPARAKNLAGLPPTYIEVGQLDIFVFEDMEYASRLVQAGVPVEFHLYPGVPHGFMVFAPDIRISKLARSNRVNAILNA